jgi:hypothetical protein
VTVDYFMNLIIFQRQWRATKTELSVTHFQKAQVTYDPASTSYSSPSDRTASAPIATSMTNSKNALL